MTYARARLWLGTTAVGSLVVIATAVLIMGSPDAMSANAGGFGSSQVLQLVTLACLFMLWLSPLDFLGGYFLPKVFQKSDQKFTAWLRGYSVAALSQSLLFVLFGSIIVLLSQQYGILGGMIAISLGIVGCFVTRNWLLLNRRNDSSATEEKLLDAITTIQSWQIFVPRTVVVQHKDNGFTGGIVGIGKYSQILIPEAWLSFTREQLATAIARRAIAINSGSYTRGLLLAFGWNVGGFLLCSLLPGASLTTVAGLTMTACGFTLWSFLGLLTLPTISRNASLRIDQQLLQQGTPNDLIASTAFTMGTMQDAGPDRSRGTEKVFHPAPNFTKRNTNEPIRGLAAWNVARTTLFFSWACLGFLSRSVQCNVGRPELWIMLPTD